MRERIEKLHNWLRGNVMSPSTPKYIALTDIEFNENEFNGSFNLTLDNDRFTPRFNLFVDMNGKYQISPPMHISPMGVPASYPSIELTDKTENAILKAINDFFPKIKPFGLDKSTGELIDVQTHIRQRVINEDELIWLLGKLSMDNFHLKVSV